MANKIVIRGDAKEVMKMFSDIQKGAEKTEAVTEKTTKGMKAKWAGVGSSISGVLAGFGIKAAADMLKSSEQMSLALDILKAKNRSVYDQLLKTEDATFGLANKFDMVTAANKALAFGIDLSDGKLNSLTKISTKLAAVMGIDVKQAFDDLVVSSARQQKLIADNLGIMIDKIAVDTAYAKQLGITKGALTEQQQSQAFLNEILKKGAVITKEVGDQFVSSATKATKALKQIETASVKAMGYLTRAFVATGEGMGWLAAKYATEGADLRDYEVRELERFNQFRIESEKLTLEELQKLKQIDKENTKEANQKIKADWKAYYKELQELKEFYSEEKGYAKQAKHFTERQRQATEATKVHLVKLSKLNEKYNLNVMEGREVDLENFTASMNKQLLVARKHLEELENDVKNSSIYKLYSLATSKLNAFAAKRIAEDAAIVKAKAIAWKKGEATRLSNKRSEVKSIISFEKELLDYSDKSNVEKLKLDAQFTIREKELLRKRISELKAIHLETAGGVDTKDAEIIAKEEKAVKLESIATYLNSRLTAIAKTGAKELEIIQNSAIEEEKRKAKELADYKEVLRNKDIELQAKANAFYVGAARDVLTAVINGNAEAIPKMLAQKAFLYGTDLVMDGTLHWLAGAAKLAGGDPVGGAEIIAGQAEIAQGLPWAIGGGIAVAGLNAIDPSSSSDTAKSEGAEDRVDLNQSLNNDKKEQIVVYEYPSKNERLESLRRQNKTIKKERI